MDRGLNSHARQQRGIAAITLAAVMVVISSGMVAVAFLTDRTQAQASVAVEQDTTATWAQDAVVGFALANGRLPCAAITRDGSENCTLAKGWFPTATVSAYGYGPTERGRRAVRYGVYRSMGASDPDLAAPKDVFQPKDASDKPIYGATTTAGSMDLCESLRLVAPDKSSGWMTDAGGATLARKDRTHVVVNGVVQNVAFAIAVPAQSAQDELSGLNAQAGTMGFEDPGRAVTSLYRDQVRVMQLGALHERLGCSAAATSLDGAAVASNWGARAVSAKTRNITTFHKTTRYESLLVTAAILDVAADQVGILNLIYTEVTGEVLSFVGLSVTSKAAGAAAMAMSKVAQANAFADMALHIIGVGVESANMVLYRAMQDKSANTHVWEGADAVVENIDQLGVSL